MNDMKTIDINPKEFIDLDPAEFLRKFEKERETFSSFRILVPKLGYSDFGKIRVKLKVPIYEMEWSDERR
ncbi:MAG: hypothetical protein V1899_04420 [Planctomycetota bacterium]